MKILVIQLRQLGDILLTTPCVREIKRAWPESHITFLCHRMGKLVLDDNPYIDHFLYYHESESWRESLGLIQKIRAGKFDLVLDFMANPRSSLHAWLSGAPRRVAIHSRRNFLFTETAKSPEPEYIVYEKFRLLDLIGIQAIDISLDLPWFEKHLEPTKQLLEENATFRDAPLRIVLSPTHRRQPRQWPLERYAQIATQLTERYGACITWAWGPGEESLIDHCIDITPVPSVKWPQISFRELAALMAQHDLFIGNSNGPSHVAVASGIPSLQIHGHTWGKSWCPNTPEHRFIQGEAHGKDRFQAIFSISCDRVLQEVEAMKEVITAHAHKRRANPLRLSWLK